jgi:squamous cell carcinoma antigen recognized by T-cells 3
MDQKDFRSRPLHVKLSTPTGAKRQATTIVSRVGKSPSVEPNGVSPSSSWASELSHTTGPRTTRTLGLMNIPDTVNDTRIRLLVESYGSIVKIILRPDHQGAIVEFADVNDAGRASLELEGYEIETGKKIHIGTVGEMMRQSAEYKTDRIQVGKQKDKPPMLIQPTVVKRPAQPGTRAGRRGGFGLKRGGGPTVAHHVDRLEAGNASATAEHEKMTKSNDDFRAMIQRSAL